MFIKSPIELIGPIPYFLWKNPRPKSPIRGPRTRKAPRGWSFRRFTQKDVTIGDGWDGISFQIPWKAGRRLMFNVQARKKKGSNVTWRDLDMLKSQVMPLFSLIVYIYIICKYPCTVCERIFDEMLPPIPKELCNHLTDLSEVWSSELASSRRLIEVVASQKCPGRSGVKMSRLRVGKMSLSVF